MGGETGAANAKWRRATCRCLAAVGGRGDALGRRMPVRVTREKGSGALEVGDERQDPSGRAAGVTGEDVDAEGAAEELGPGEPLPGGPEGRSGLSRSRCGGLRRRSSGRRRRHHYRGCRNFGVRLKQRVDAAASGWLTFTEYWAAVNERPQAAHRWCRMGGSGSGATTLARSLELGPNTPWNLSCPHRSPHLAEPRLFALRHRP